MISELVLDTNVLAHCCNPNEPRRKEALELVLAIQHSSTSLCVDDGFSIVESQNRSIIGAEYMAHLVYGSLGLYLIQFLAVNGRVRVYPKRPPHDIARRINRVIRNAHDRAFVGVAWHSSERVLVSHDYTDFDHDKRIHLSSELGVDVIDSRQCLDEHCGDRIAPEAG